MSDNAKQEKKQTKKNLNKNNEFERFNEIHYINKRTHFNRSETFVDRMLTKFV